MKSMLKKLAIGLLVPLFLGSIAAGGFGAWYFFIRVTPQSVLKDAVGYARQRNAEKFKGCFSAASVRALEGSWTGETYGGVGGWESMMAGLLSPNGAPPEVKEIVEGEGRARADVRINGERRTIYLIKDKTWHIDVLVGVDESLSKEARKANADLKNEALKGTEKLKAPVVVEEPKEEAWWKD